MSCIAQSIVGAPQTGKTTLAMSVLEGWVVQGFAATYVAPTEEQATWVRRRRSRNQVVAFSGWALFARDILICPSGLYVFDDFNAFPDGAPLALRILESRLREMPHPSFIFKFSTL